MDARTRMWGFRHVATRYLNPLTRLLGRTTHRDDAVRADAARLTEAR